MTGRIVQINTSPGGLPKRAAAAGNLEFRGFQGDSWAHPQIHGGPNQAVLLIASEAIATLVEKGFPLYPGALGENLTTEGLDPAAWRMGQQYRAGEAIIELTKIRVPCNALDVYSPAIKQAIYDSAVKAGDTASPRWGVSGFYAKVIREGLILPGNPIALLSELA